MNSYRSISSPGRSVRLRPSLIKHASSREHCRTSGVNGITQSLQQPRSNVQMGGTGRSIGAPCRLWRSSYAAWFRSGHEGSCSKNRRLRAKPGSHALRCEGSRIQPWPTLARRDSISSMSIGEDRSRMLTPRLGRLATEDATSRRRIDLRWQSDCPIAISSRSLADNHHRNASELDERLAVRCESDSARTSTSLFQRGSVG